MKHFLYLLLLALLASCTEQERILPKIELDQPYYPNLKPSQEWGINYNSVLGDIKFAGDLVLIHNSNPSIEAYHQEDGRLIWETHLGAILGHLRFEDYIVELVGNSIYMIDQKTPMVLIINYETGQIEGFNKAIDDNVKLRKSFGGNLIDNSIYFFKYIEPGHYSFNKYDYIQDTGEELLDLKNYNLGFSEGNTCFYEADNQVFFAELKLENGETETQIILSIDRKTYDTTLVYEQSLEKDNSLIIYNDLYVKDGILFSGKNNEGVIGMDIKTGEILWINEEEGYVHELFGHEGHVFVKNGLDLYQIEPKTGQIKWVTPSFGNSSANQPLENMSLAVSATENITYDPDLLYWWRQKVITIYDLNNGQRLVEKTIDHPDDSDLYFRAINVHEMDGEKFIFVATQSYLYKYSWPL